MVSKRRTARSLVAIRRLAYLLGAGFLVMQSAGCSAQSGGTLDQAQYVCAVGGAEVLSPQMTAEAVCAVFKQHIDAILPQPSRAVPKVSLADANWIKLDIKFTKTGTALARVVSKGASGEVQHPEIAVDIMDRQIGLNQVTALAEEVAKLVAG
jgi:hypothetical protein